MAQYKRNRAKLPAEARRRIEISREVARQDMAIGLMSLFCQLRDSKTRKYIEEIKQPWNGGVISVNGPELSSFDQDVLFGLLALALQRERDCEKKSGLEIPEINAGGGVESADTLTLRTGYAELARIMGYESEDMKPIKKAIKRLSSVVVEAQTKDAWATSHLIHGAAGKGRGAVKVVFSWRLTRALLGDGSYAAVSMSDRRILPGGLARLVHAWLCAWFASQSGRRSISLETLESHVYREPAKSDRTTRDRRQKLRAAVDSLRMIGWGVKWRGDIAEIERRMSTATDKTPVPLPENPCTIAADESVMPRQ